MEQLNISAVGEAEAAVDSLEDRLLVLRLSLGKLRVAFAQAFDPIVYAAVPALTEATRAVTNFVKDVAAVLGALFGSVQQEAKTTVKTTGAGVKKALAGFDQLERLSFGGGGGRTLVTIPAAIKKLPEELEPIVQKLRELLAPLQELDLSKAKAAFEQLRQALEPLTRALFDGLEWAWKEIFVPMAQWSVEQALPAFLRVLTEAARLLGAGLNTVKPIFLWFWEKFLQPLAAWTGQAFLSALEGLRLALQAVGNALEWVKTRFVGLKTGLGEAGLDLTGFVEKASPAQRALTALGELARGFAEALSLCGRAVTLVSSLLQTLLAAMGSGIRGMLNTLIGVVNTAISAIETVLNSLVEAINSLGFTVPSWVPGIGGKKLSLGLEEVSLPRVPALARGAVLPPNKPFLAMVGDHKHGTNIEAPLGVIQEAVANVLDRDGSARLLEQILHAIENIRVGDETIGRAARRYEQRWAVMGGAR